MERLAAIYARVSTEEQAATSGIPSNETQIDLCKRKAEALGIPVAARDSGLIVDDTHRGSDLRWQGSRFMELVRRAQRHEFTDLICLDIDRFCRGGVHAYFEQEGYFVDAQVHIHYVHDDIPADMPFRSSIIAARADAAQWWKDKLREASTRVREAYAKDGNFIPGHIPPFGWEWVVDETKRTRKDKPVKIGLRPHPVYASVLLHMYEHVADGGSVWSLVKWLENNHIPTPRSASTWQMSVIRRILHNPTNWGERITFQTRTTPRPEGVRRAATMKTATYHRRSKESEQYEPKRAVIEPIPGLTKDLAMRALDRLSANEQNARRRATHTEEERAERGLLFNGGLRCGVCGYGMRLKRSHPSVGQWHYICYHNGNKHYGEKALSISARVLDRAVWAFAVRAIRDPDFFDRLIAKSDEVAGAAARAASLERQLADAERERERLFKQLARLDDDDPDDQPSITHYQLQLKQRLTAIKELEASLAATRAEVNKERTRRASIEAFHEYAAAQREALSSKTPIQRRHLLDALRTHVRLHTFRDQQMIEIDFDVRSLPGAVEALAPAAQLGQRIYVNRDKESPLARAVVNMKHGIRWLEAGFPDEDAFDAYLEEQLALQERAGQRLAQRYERWLTQTGREDTDEAWWEWTVQDHDAYEQWLTQTGREGGDNTYEEWCDLQDESDQGEGKSGHDSTVRDTMNASAPPQPNGPTGEAFLAARREIPFRPAHPTPRSSQS